jgi:hypothetical protein
MPIGARRSSTEVSWLWCGSRGRQRVAPAKGLLLDTLAARGGGAGCRRHSEWLRRFGCVVVLSAVILFLVIKHRCGSAGAGLGSRSLLLLLLLLLLFLL